MGDSAQCWSRGGIFGGGRRQASLGQKGVIRHPFDTGRSTGVTMTPIHRENWRGTVGGVNVDERVYVEDHEEEGGDASSDSNINSRTVQSPPNGWMGNGMEHHHSLLAVARLHRD